MWGDRFLYDASTLWTPKVRIIRTLGPSSLSSHQSTSVSRSKLEGVTYYEGYKFNCSDTYCACRDTGTQTLDFLGPYLNEDGTYCYS